MNILDALEHRRRVMKCNYRLRVLTRVYKRHQLSVREKMAVKELIKSLEFKCDALEARFSAPLCIENLLICKQWQSLKTIKIDKSILIPILRLWFVSAQGTCMCVAVVCKRVCMFTLVLLCLFSVIALVPRQICLLLLFKLLQFHFLKT